VSALEEDPSTNDFARANDGNLRGFDMGKARTGMEYQEKSKFDKSQFQLELANQKTVSNNILNKQIFIKKISELERIIDKLKRDKKNVEGALDT
jgi:hypothetical protein